MLDEFLNVQAGLSRGGPRWWWDDADLNDEQRDAVLQAVHRPDVSDRAVQLVLGQVGCEGDASTGCASASED
jgi:hypothetical protein